MSGQDKARPRRPRLVLPPHDDAATHHEFCRLRDATVETHRVALRAGAILRDLADEFAMGNAREDGSDG